METECIPDTIAVPKVGEIWENTYNMDCGYADKSDPCVVINIRDPNENGDNYDRLWLIRFDGFSFMDACMVKYVYDSTNFQYWRRIA